MGSLFQELKRRNVVRVGVAYLALVWVVLQVTELAVPALNLPESLNSTVFYLGLIGFPFALFFAWAFELTPEGLMKTEDVDNSKSVTHSTGRKLDFAIIGLLAIAVSWLAIDRFVGGGASLQQADGTAAAIDKSIAVLPFENFSSDEELGWFADGLSDEILNALARTPDLEVTSRTSSFRFRNPVDETPVIAEQLGVAYILEGSVRGDDNLIRVTAQLIRAEGDVHVWSDTYDRAPDDIITIQEEIAVAIALELETVMDPQALAAMVQTGTSSAAAYEIFLKGRALSQQGLRDGSQLRIFEALALFDEARVLDPGFAEAHFEAARYWGSQLRITNIGYREGGISTGERVDNYRQRVQAAIDTATSERRGLLYQSSLAEIDSRYRERIRLLEQFLELDPNEVEVWVVLTGALANMNRLDESLDAFQRGAMLLNDDIAPYSRFIQSVRMFEQPDLATPLIEKALTMDPANTNLLYQSHRAYLWSGRVTEAAELLSMQEGLPPGDFSLPMMRIRQACAENRQADAQQLYQDIMQDDGPSSQVTIRWLAAALMGEREIMDELLRPFDTPESLVGISSWLTYPYFDPSPFPNLSAVLQREGREARALVQIPFACESL